MGNTGFGSEDLNWSRCSAQVTEGLTLTECNDRILVSYTFIPFLQYVNQWFPRCLCMGSMGFGSEDLNWSRCSAQVTEGLTLTECKFLPKAMLYILDNSVYLWVYNVYFDC